MYEVTNIRTGKKIKTFAESPFHAINKLLSMFGDFTPSNYIAKKIKY
jgi:hypothetical protein